MNGSKTSMHINEKTEKEKYENNVKEKLKNMVDVTRGNEALMESGTVSSEEFDYWAGLEMVYSVKTTKAAQQISGLLNGLSIKEANIALDLTRENIKRHCVIKIR
jgi:hypothetical protein